VVQEWIKVRVKEVKVTEEVAVMVVQEWAT
jgi:hypothetical protein